MNDYKELIALLNGAMMITASNGKIEKADLFCKAADAIEQLVKERDAAIADIACLVNDPNVPAESLCKKFTNHGCCCYNYYTGEQVRDCTGFEWRGVQEADDEKERNL